MKLFNDLMLKFEKYDSSKNPDFGVIDRILELHPEIHHVFKFKGEVECPGLQHSVNY